MKSIHPYLTSRLNSTVDLYREIQWSLNRSWFILAELDVCQRWGERGRLAVSEGGEREGR